MDERARIDRRNSVTLLFDLISEETYYGTNLRWELSRLYTEDRDTYNRLAAFFARTAAVRNSAPDYNPEAARADLRSE